jgi:SAM-dependent methyltransferase
MNIKDTIKNAVRNSSFSEQQIHQILEHCNRKVPDYSDYFNELRRKALSASDDECVNLSVEGEIHYLISQSYRIASVIEYLQKAIQLLGSGKKLRVLDIGATQFTILYKNYFDFEIVALDRTSLLKARFARESIEFIEHDFANENMIPEPENSFDICIFTEVFEHLIVPPRKVFLPIKMILKDKGVLIFSTPNITRLNNRINLLLGRRILDPIEWVLRDDFDTESAHGLGHIREYSIHELLALIEKYNFRLIENCFPDESASILQNNTLKNLTYRFIKKTIPSTRHHCQLLATLQKS